MLLLIASAPPASHRALAGVDFAIIGFYFAIIFGIGFYFSIIEGRKASAFFESSLTA